VGILIKFMNICSPNIMIIGAMTVLISCCAPSSSEDGNNGEKYARSRITIDGEKEWSEVKAHPGKYHIPISRPNHPAFDDVSMAGMQGRSKGDSSFPMNMISG